MRTPRSQCGARSMTRSFLTGQVRQPGVRSVGTGDGISEPATLFDSQHRQGCGEIHVVFRAALLGLVEQLNFGAKKGYSVAAGVTERCNRASHVRIAPRDPGRTTGFVQHELDTPGLVSMGTAPDVMHTDGQALAGTPRTQHARRISGPPLPTGQEILDGQVIAPQQEHVDIGVLAYRASHGEFDGVPAGDPPRRGASGEQRDNLAEGRWFPDAPRSVCPDHRDIVLDRAGLRDLTTLEEGMSMSANVVVDQTSVSAVVHAFVDEFLPTFAMAAGLMALVWLACAVVAVCGAYVGVLAVLGIRHLFRACRHYLQRGRTVEYAQLVIAHPDGASTKVINLNRYRHRRCRRTRPSGQTDPDSA